MFISNRIILALAATSGVMIVSLGAFGAHVMSDILSHERLGTLETGIRYQMFHTLALICVVLTNSRHPSKLLSTSSLFFILGMLLFCGSLYALTFGAPRMLGIITPFGGMCFILGWLLLVYASFKVKLP